MFDRVNTLTDITNNITYNTFHKTENLVHLFHKFRFVPFLIVLWLLEN